MRYFYIDEAEGPNRYVLTAVAVDNASWLPLLDAFHSWLKHLEAEHHVPAGRKLSARDLVAGKRRPGCFVNSARRLTPEQGASAFRDGLRVIEDAARDLGGVQVINVCVEKDGEQDYRRLSLDRMLGRIHAWASGAGRQTLLIFNQARQRKITALYRQVLEHGENGGLVAADPTNLGPSFRNFRSDGLVLAPSLVAHALLLQEDDLGLHRAYGILHHALEAGEPARYARGTLRS